MNIGDRVRLMTGREEGTVTRLLEGNLIEVAIDNEFTIPLRRSDVVLIAAEETKAFGERPAPAPPPKPPVKQPHTQPAKPIPQQEPNPAAVVVPEQSASSSPGLTPAPRPSLPAVAAPAAAPTAIGTYLVLTYQTEELLNVQLVNNADEHLLFTYGEERQNHYKGVKSGQIEPRAATALGFLHLHDFEQWPAVVMQYLPHRAGGSQLHGLETARVRFRAETFYASRGLAPLLKREGYIYRLAEHRLVASALLPAEPRIDPRQLAEQMMTPTALPPVKVTAPSHEVDLHLDKLADAPAGEVAPAEALRLQMAAFEDALQRALATNMHEIIFIHGAGNGTLRKEIQRALSRNRDIKFFEDAQKEKFGFGATRVRLK